jgi:hypothetical protein
MATKIEIIKRLKAENPKIYHNTNNVQTEVTGDDYDALIESWADFQIAKIAEEKAQANAKQAILDRLGLTADEVKLLLS